MSYSSKQSHWISYRIRFDRLLPVECLVLYLHVVYFCIFCIILMSRLETMTNFYRYFESLALLETEAKTDANNGWMSHPLNKQIKSTNFNDIPCLPAWLIAAVWGDGKTLSKCSFGAVITIFLFLKMYSEGRNCFFRIFCVSFSTRALKKNEWWTLNTTKSSIVRFVHAWHL